MFPGILDQSKFLDSGGQETVVLQLLGNDYQDTSGFNHTVNIVGSVPINNGGFNITHNGDNYLEIPDHPEFNFADKDFYIQLDFKSIGANINTAHFFSQHDSGDTAYYIRFGTSGNNSVVHTHSINGSSASVTSATLPDTDFLSSFQTLKILKATNPNNSNTDAFLYYYKGNLIQIVSSIYGNFTLHNSSAPIRIGKHIVGSKFAADYVLKNIKFVRID